jgi:hypothetical protein
LNLGFRFGYCLLGTAAFEVAHFAFEFYGFATYNVMVNPNNLIVQTVLSTMVESGDYFFFTVDPTQGATAFRSEIGDQNLVGLKTNLPRIQRSTTTETQYLSAVAQFRRQPTPPGQVLNWVCRDKADSLNLTQDRLELSPA